MNESDKFKILSSRLRISIIKKLSNKDCFVKELAVTTGKRSSKICDELAVLRNHRIVTAYNIGIRTYYHLNDDSFIKIINFTERH